MSDWCIRPIAATPAALDDLATLLVETVASGGSVSFLHPLAFEEAYDFWTGSLEAAGRGERVLLGAFEGSGSSGRSRCSSAFRRTSRIAPRSASS